MVTLPPNSTFSGRTIYRFCGTLPQPALHRPRRVSALHSRHHDVERRAFSILQSPTPAALLVPASKTSINKESVMQINIIKKRCSTCGKILPVTAFNHDRKAKDGFTHNCRECRKIAAREYRKSLRLERIKQ